MFDFLKKLFGKNQDPSEQNPEIETVTRPAENHKTNDNSTIGLVQPSIRPEVRQETVQKPAVQYNPTVVRQEVQKPTVQPNPPVAKQEVQKPAVQPKSPVMRQETVLEPPVQPVAKYERKYVATPTRPSTPNTSQHRVVAPRTQSFTSVAPANRIQKYSVYIGLDFGTTFTKAAYEIAPSNVHTKYSVKFGNSGTKEDYYLPSILYFDPASEKLKISDPSKKCEEIRYFKYSMISDALQKNEVLNHPAFITRSTKEQLCCVFYLSYVINFIRNAVHKNFERTMNQENTSWYINMGVPLAAHKNDKDAELYKKVLKVAYLFEQRYKGLTEIDIHELDEFYSLHSEEPNPNINILPEIYAEVLLYQQYLNTPAGFYTVVDIGGGTEDIATFLKMTDRFGEKVDCLAQKVIGYGYDSIAEKIVTSVSYNSIEKAKALLKRKIDFNDGESLRLEIPREVNYDSLLDARRECRTLFGSCVQRARRTNDDIMKQTVDERLPMYVFVMGGANSVEFYRSSIEYMKKAQGNAGIPFFKDSDVFDYVGRNSHGLICRHTRMNSIRVRMLMTLM